MVTANEIRTYTSNSFIVPARNRNENIINISLTDIRKGMGLTGYYRLIDSSISAKVFEAYAGVTLIRREGPKESPRVTWTFKLNPKESNDKKSLQSFLRKFFMKINC